MSRHSDITFRGVVLAIILAVLLAASNAFLALKLGLLTSASIPAAIISMGVLRFFKGATILENNAVQTAASAGEAIAGGIVYTIPALIIIQYWYHFDYWINFSIAFFGGVLGVLFSIPLRKILVHDPVLKFPEGRAIAEVLKSSYERVGFIYLLLGGFVGAFLELFQVGLKVLASTWSYWFSFKRTLWGMNLGFSATMIGAGFLVGQNMVLSIFVGAVIAWWIGLPIVSHLKFETIASMPLSDAVSALWASDVRYLGIGAMLFAGIWTFMQLVKPLWQSMHSLFRVLYKGRTSFESHRARLPMTERDLSWSVMGVGVFAISIGLYFLFHQLFALSVIGFSSSQTSSVLVLAIAYVLFVGFLFSVITAYFSGMVGVTASPGSSVVIAGILFASWLLLIGIRGFIDGPLTNEGLKAAEAMTIIVGSIVTGIAAIANDNSQDLKVGQLVGATPWKQQCMLLLGVLVSSLVVPWVMQLLFDVYGIAGVMPRPGMDSSLSLPAPTAALLAAITTAVFHHDLPWSMMSFGASIILALMLINHLLKRRCSFQFSALGVAVGMYLPLSTSFPLLLGGLISFLGRRGADTEVEKQPGTLMACGLVAGSALMDVVLAGIFSFSHTQDVLVIMPEQLSTLAVGLSFLSIMVLGIWMIRCMKK
jgi:putative OPT family oligopeptide transporter